MHAHKLRVLVPASRQVVIDLPSEFPEGSAELIVLAEGDPMPAPSDSPGTRALAFTAALGLLAARIRDTGPLADEAFDRGALNDRDGAREG